MLIDKEDHAGNVIGQRLPKLLETDPPPPLSSLPGRWKKARKEFRARHKLIRKRLDELEVLRESLRRLGELMAQTTSLVAELQQARVQYDAVSQHGELFVAEAELRERDSYKTLATLEQVISRRPGWWARLWRTNAFVQWRQIERAASERHAHARSALQDAQQKSKAAIEHIASCHEVVIRKSQVIASHQKSIEMLQAEIQLASAGLGPRFVDGNYFGVEHAVWNLQTPWLDTMLQAEREALFVDALKIHRLFMEMSAQKLLHNIGVLQAILLGKGKQELNKWLPQLWSSLFIAVPVVSTTFASVERMLGPLPPDSLGWAMIDEAGQATPQAAVGLLMRTRRAVVVGDPLQIPPVVSMPSKLVDRICAAFAVETDRWAAPLASVQTLADAVSPYRAVFEGDVGVRDVGLPLLVHRRCQEPMFSLSNAMAYAGQMVQAVVAQDGGQVGDVLGASGWFDVLGQTDDKWSPAEGLHLIELLKKVADAGVSKPDIYVITPFRNVANELRELLTKNRPLLKRLGADLDDWKKNRIGTIHTFQGKEAEVVIAVLGAPAERQRGARQWATSDPNILNVMVSRARKRFYVIGARAPWAANGHARTLAAGLPVKILGG